MIDLLDVYYVEHAKKLNDIDDFFYGLCLYVFEKGDEARVEAFFDKTIEYTRNANHELPRKLAHRQFAQGKYSTAHVIKISLIKHFRSTSFFAEMWSISQSP